MSTSAQTTVPTKTVVSFVTTITVGHAMTVWTSGTVILLVTAVYSGVICDCSGCSACCDSTDV